MRGLAAGGPNLFAAGLAFALAGCAAVPDRAPTQASRISYERAIVLKADAAGDDVAAYVIFANRGSGGSEVVSASCECARTVELHRVVPGEGMVTNWPLELPAGAREAIEPPGVPRHMMLVDVKRPIAVGSSVTIRFAFADGSASDQAFTAVASSTEAWQALAQGAALP